MQMIPRIRPATAEDAIHLPPIERAAGELFRQWPGLEWIADDTVTSAARHHEMIDAGFSLVAETADCRIIGFASAEMIGQNLHLWQIAIAPTHQRQGIGAAMIDAIQILAKHHATRAITLTTFRDVPWNQPWYQRLGFVILTEADTPPDLHRILSDEAQTGLTNRCAMSRPV